MGLNLTNHEGLHFECEVFAHLGYGSRVGGVETDGMRCIAIDVKKDNPAASIELTLMMEEECAVPINIDGREVLESLAFHECSQFWAYIVDVL